MYKEVYKKDSLSVKGLKWITKEPDLDSIKKLDKNFNISNVVKAIISNRNFSSLGIEQYLSPTLRELTPNPMDLHDMDKAIDKFNLIIKNDQLKEYNIIDLRISNQVILSNEK